MSAREEVHIRLFDGPRVISGGEELRQFPTRHSAAILVLLALSPARRITRDEIADTQWPDEALHVSRRRIREHLFRLRETLPRGRDLILSDSESIWLSDRYEYVVDAAEFDRILTTFIESREEGRKTELFEAADALYEGPFAPSLDRPRFDAERERHAVQHAECLRALAGLTAESDPDRALGYALRATEADPFSESAQEDLIRLYAALGRVVDARRQYRTLEKLWRKELRAEPSRQITSFVRGLPNGGSQPRARVGGAEQVARAAVSLILWRRRARVYGAIAAASAALGVAAVVMAHPWHRSRPFVPPTTPEDRIARIRRLRRVPGQPDNHARERAYECIALAEQAWNDPNGWWGRDEEIWVSRLGRVDGDIENSLVWLQNHDPPGEIKLAGALARYWVFPEHRLDAEAHWLKPAQDERRLVADLDRARALVGLSRYYLLFPPSEAKPGFTAAAHALALYRNCRNSWGEAHALRYVALHEHYQGQNRKAIDHFRTALAAFLRLRDERALAQTYECMSYISPSDPGSRMTSSDQIMAMCGASRLYRRLQNPRGIADSERLLSGLTWPSVLRTAEPAAVTALTDELRVQSARDSLTHNVGDEHFVWKALARIALRTGDVRLVCDSIAGLVGSAGSDYTLEDTGRLCGAYSHLLPTAAPDIFPPDCRPSLTGKALTDRQKAQWRTGFGQGLRMTPKHAVALAISH